MLNNTMHKSFWEKKKNTTIVVSSEQWGIDACRVRPGNRIGLANSSLETKKIHAMCVSLSVSRVKSSPSCSSNYHCCYKTTSGQAHCCRSQRSGAMHQRCSCKTKASGNITSNAAIPDKTPHFWLCLAATNTT